MAKLDKFVKFVKRPIAVAYRDNSNRWDPTR